MGPYKDYLDSLNANGLEGVVWLGGYNTKTCSFYRDDNWVRSVVSGIKDHAAILAYQIADEPNHHLCPQSPVQMRQRSELVKLIDPDAQTYVVVPVWDGEEGFPYQHFAESADIMGLDVYPCVRGRECSLNMIDRAIAEADRDGVDRYWAVLQTFESDWYRFPSPEELVAQFRRWEDSRMEGYFVYQWTEEGIGASEPIKDMYADVNRGREIR